MVYVSPHQGFRHMCWQRCTGLPNKSPYKKWDTYMVCMYLPIKYSDRYDVKASCTCVGKGVQVSLTNLPTKNGTHNKW
jgi:hypothetical protein